MIKDPVDAVCVQRSVGKLNLDKFGFNQLQCPFHFQRLQSYFIFENEMGMPGD